jgi:hypothetical protein
VAGLGVRRKVVVETREKQGTTQDGTKTSYKQTERRFCFEGKRDGDYLLAFVLHKNGVPQPAIIFPTNYSHKRNKFCDSVYRWSRSVPGNLVKNRRHCYGIISLVGPLVSVIACRYRWHNWGADVGRTLCSE